MSTENTEEIFSVFSVLISVAFLIRGVRQAGRNNFEGADRKLLAILHAKPDASLLDHWIGHGPEQYRFQGGLADQ